MTAFVATLGPKLYTNWAICKTHGLWGVVDSGSNWRSNVARVTIGDQILVWRGGRPNGFIAIAQVVGKPAYRGQAGFSSPWPDPHRYGAVVPFRVVVELPVPEGDSFTQPGRVGSRFGFNNTVLQHVFEAVAETQASRIRAAFPTSAVLTVGVPYVTPAAPSGVSPAEPFTVDPDLVDRGLRAHHDTVERLATWVTSRGFVPLTPAPGEPSYDLAWLDGAVLNVAEVKSTTPHNEEKQLRLGLGQVLRYRSVLRSHHSDVRAWLVPERSPADATWKATCMDVEIELRPM